MWIRVVPPAVASLVVPECLEGIEDRLERACNYPRERERESQKLWEATHQLGYLRSARSVEKKVDTSGELR